MRTTSPSITARDKKIVLGMYHRTAGKPLDAYLMMGGGATSAVSGCTHEDKSKIASPSRCWLAEQEQMAAPINMKILNERPEKK